MLLSGEGGNVLRLSWPGGVPGGEEGETVWRQLP